MLPMSVQQLTSVLQKFCPAEAMDAQYSKVGTIIRVTTDSRNVLPGDLFVAIVGESFDGHQFVAQSLKQGAVTALVSSQWWRQASVDLRSATFPCDDVIDAFR